MSRPKNPVITEELAKKLLYRCMVCDKSIEGFYSRHGDQGTCSKACMNVQDRKPRYPGYTEEDYFNRQGETFGDEDGFEADA